MSPRRSSRARTSQPSPAILQHTNSSSSSNSLTRERSTRSNHKNNSPHGSSTQRSQSIDDADAASKSDFRETRQRQRARDEDHDSHLKLADREEEEIEEDEEDEEEEVTRCLCGQQEYPGLPPSRRDTLGRMGARTGFKEENSLNLSTDSSDLMSDDIGSMFIQCDSCKVWQHGGCVGIMDEAMSPDEYYCEECRKDLHKIRSEVNGQFSSQYLPVAAPSSAVTSRESSRDNSKRNKDHKSRQNDSTTNPKRRSTMNSRDAAYDEEEQLRRAIEESKEDNKSGSEEVTRRPKRSRSDSEAHRQAPKRQRTSSPSPDLNSKQSNPPSQPASEDESKTKTVTNGTRRQRAASRSQRDKDVKEQIEEPETEQMEVANRRKGRNERRKGEGADSDHEVSSPTKSVAVEQDPPQQSPDVVAPTPEPAPTRPSTRKSGRPPARRGGRVGRNQYTRDRDGNGTESNAGNSPRRGQSHDTGGDSPRVSGVNGTPVNSGESGKPSRPRYVNQRTTMNEMKRRVAAILEFISRMQVEMAAAGESTTPPGNGDRPNGTNLKAESDQLAAMLAKATEGEPRENTADANGGTGQVSIEKDFKDLSSVEMMDVLTRHLLKWQQEYGKFGER